MRLDDVNVLWQANCFWGLQACVDHMAIAGLEITLPPSEDEQQREIFPLPAVPAPIPIRADSLTLQRLQINGKTQFEATNLAARAQWTSHLIDIEQLTGRSAGFAVGTSGHLQLQGDYALLGRLSMDGDQGDTLSVEFDGTLREIDTRLRLRGRHDADAQVRLRPLESDTPMRGTVQLSSLLQFPLGESGQLTISGSSAR